MKHYMSIASSLLIILVVVVSGCSSTTEEQPLDLKEMTWEEVVAVADGQTVNWWMWGGSDTINTFVNGWMAEQLKERYNITLNQVPVAGPTEFINQVLGEKEAGVDDGGLAGEPVVVPQERLGVGPGLEGLHALFDLDDALVAVTGPAARGGDRHPELVGEVEDGLARL